MDMQHTSRKLIKVWRAFRSNRRGNVAIIFALAAFPILGFVGVAIDYTRANAAKVKMQSALDATALMLAKDAGNPSISDDALKTKGTAYFKALYKVDPDPMTVTRDLANRTLNVGATVTVPNTPFYNSLHRWVGHLNGGAWDPSYRGVMAVGSSTQVKWGSKLRVALALDTTGSMDQTDKNGRTKISALKTAVAGVGGAIDSLAALKKDAGDVYISIVPFAMHVNLKQDANTYQATYIDWTDWEAPPPGSMRAADVGRFELSLHERKRLRTAVWQPGERAEVQSQRRHIHVRRQDSEQRRVQGLYMPEPVVLDPRHAELPLLQRLLRQRRVFDLESDRLFGQLRFAQQLFLHGQRLQHGLHPIQLHPHVAGQQPQHLDRLRARPRLSAAAGRSQRAVAERI